MLVEMRIRAGGDPCGFVEFQTMRQELAKLSHPACPDLDWFKVEQLCQSLFSKNGAELQTVAAYTLARGHTHGPQGIIEGIRLIEMLVSEGACLWPAAESDRMDILASLFTQLQALLRSLRIGASDLPELVRLDARLDSLHLVLLGQMRFPTVALQALRQQLGIMIQRLEQAEREGVLAQPTSRTRPSAFPASSLIMPVLARSTPAEPATQAERAKRKERSVLLWVMASMLVMLAVLFGWQSWLAEPEKKERSVLKVIFKQERKDSDAVHLDSLMLFDSGSAELKAGSTKLLINALIGIKAKPDWLIMVTGHSDSTGDAERNLQLSRARAAVVGDWMQKMGNIAGSCFAVRGVAASQPVASNATSSGRAENRRVDIQLVPRAGACSQSDES